jgi:hypothetical protein
MDLEERASDPRDSNLSDGYRGFVSPRSVSGFAARRPGDNGLLVLPVRSSAAGGCDLKPALDPRGGVAASFVSFPGSQGCTRTR